MANTAATSPGTMADDATVGTVAWTNPDNAKVSDNVYAKTGGLPRFAVQEKSIKLVKGGTIQGDDKSDFGLLPYNTEAYKSYGDATSLWGLSWSYSDINSSDFGFVYSAGNGTTLSHYLKATNFGFSIPSGATINGIKVEVERMYSADATYAYANVDHIRITVYYTEAAAAAQAGFLYLMVTS